MVFWQSLLLLVCLAVHSDCFINPYPKIKDNFKACTSTKQCKTDPGKPLILTDLINAGNISYAQNLSYVNLTAAGITLDSYSGFFQVNSTGNLTSALFFWFFPAQNKPAEAPVLVWLQGGPGASSLFGLFQEHGPLMLNETKENPNSSIPFLDLRRTHWAKDHNVIYIDNPVGTGLSFSQHNDMYSRNESHVGVNLYKAILQFFKLFPNYQNNSFYVTGESYAGKYVPALAYTIHLNNPVAKVKINLKGIAIGNGLCDPLNMMVYSTYLFELGLIDENVKKEIEAKEKEASDLILQWDWDKAYNIFDEIINGDFKNLTILYNNTKFTNYFNFLQPFKDPKPDILMGELFKNSAFRQAIHIGNSTFHDGKTVETFLKADVMQSVKGWIQILLNNTNPQYQVLFYNGQLDIIVAYPLTVNFLKTLEWSGAAEYKNAKRSVWYYNNQTEIAGFVKKVKTNFYEVLIRNAGHMAPSDQPEWTLDLITKFTNNKL